MDGVSNSVLRSVFQGLEQAAARKAEPGDAVEPQSIKDFQELFSWQSQASSEALPNANVISVAGQLEDPEAYLKRYVSSARDEDDSIVAALESSEYDRAAALEGMAESIQSAADDETAKEQLGNFEIQDLLSQYNEAQQLASSIEQKRLR